MRTRTIVLAGLCACAASVARAQAPADTIQPPPTTAPVFTDTLLTPTQLPGGAAPGGAAPGATAPPPAAEAVAPGADTATGPTVLRDTSFVVDRVLAVVGTHPVLESQVDEEIFSRQSQGLTLPQTQSALDSLRRQVVQSIVDEQLLVQEAQRDTTIKVTDQEINEGVEQQIKKVRSNFSSEAEYAAELKKAGFETPDEYRRWLGDQQRRAAYQNRLIEKLRGEGKLKSVVPNEEEMKEYFAAQKDNLAKRPATISFSQIVVAPTPSLEAKQRAYELADSIAIALRKGGDFALAAKRFSDDSASREQGGSLNWFRRGVMLPQFERVAFVLKPGVISDPVETQFGYHIIQVQRTQPGEVQARHILIAPEITPAEVDSARIVAEAVAKAARAGAPFDSLQQAHQDQSEQKEANDIPITKLPPAYAQAIGDAPAGTVLDPFPLQGAQGRTKYAVVKVTERRPAGDVRYEDVKDEIRDQLGQQLSIRRYLDRLKAETYVDVRM
ncbi:MAG TPA: peptidylprolyl isomerase [Gemmatimonadales bacterium]|nr:peptidylprolyl isomerase [Gemmatimonadales bacterium]